MMANLMGLGQDYGVTLIKVEKEKVMNKQITDLEEKIKKKENERKQLQDVIKVAAANVIRALPFQIEIELYLIVLSQYICGMKLM